MKKISAVTLCLFLIFGFSGLALASIEIHSGGKGTLMITDPNATDPDKLITMIDLAKQPIPPIPSGAILEILDGEITVTVTGDDTVDITILDYEMTLKNGQTVTVSSTENEGLVTPVTGDLTIVDPMGEEKLVKAGQNFPIKLTEAGNGDETAAGGATGLPAPDNASPTDSRSMESSPAQ